MEGVVFSLKNGVGRHWVALVLGLAVSFVYGLHHIVLSQEPGEYHPMVVNEDEALFTGPKAHAAEMREIIVGDFNVAEYKDTRVYVLPFLSPLIMGTLARVVGGIERAFIVGDFLFPPIIFLLFYGFLLLLFGGHTGEKTFQHSAECWNVWCSGYRILALFGATLFVFIPQFLLAVPPVTPYLQAMMLTLAAKGSSLYFSRVEDPQLTVPLYLAALICFFLIFTGRKEKWITAAAGILYGLLFYSYFYYWMWTSMALAIGIALTWRAMPDVRKHLMRAMGLGLLLSVPHWMNGWMVASLPQYPDIFDRLRPEVGRALNLQPMALFAYFLHALLAAAWLLMRKDRPATAAFLLAFLLPVYAAYNIQIITGFNVHPDHWYKPAMPIVNAALLLAAYYLFKTYGSRLTVRMVVAPWGILALLFFLKAMNTDVALVRMASVGLLVLSSAVLLWIGMREKISPIMRGRIYTGVAILGILLLFGKGAAVQRQFIATNRTKTLPAEEAESYRWLARHTPAYSVVASPSFTTNARVQLYTRNRLLLPNGYNTIAGDRELWERLRFANKLFGTDPAVYRAYLTGTSALGGGGEDDAPTDNLYFAFKPRLDTTAVYYLFHMHYLDASPGGTSQSTDFLAFPQEVIEREDAAYRAAVLPDPLPYRADYLYYGPRERLLVPDASALARHEKIYDRKGIIIYKLVSP